MQTHHLSTRMSWGGYGTAAAAFVVSALFFVDVFGEYFVNTSYLFAIDYWIEFTVAIVAAAAGVALTYITHRWR